MRRIKRGNYSGIYSSRRRRRSSSALKTVIFIILAAAVVFVGYSISDPLIRLFSGNLKPTAASHISSSKSTASSSKKASSSKAGSSSKLKAAAVRGVYLPKSYLSNTAELNSFISQAKSAGINLAVIDLKAEDGVVNYASKTDSAKEAMAQGAPDASAAAKALSDAGITPAARICAFQDPVAPSVLRGAGVLYSQNHSMNWLDPSGNRWLNPNSQQAQQYITSLATEAVSLGYKQIFIDSLTFPTKGNPDSQGYYGDNMTSKEQVISDYVKTLKQQVNAAGGKLTVMAAGAAAVGQANENAGPKDVFTLSGDFISPNLCPSFLTDSSIQAGTATINSGTSPADAVTAFAQYIKSNKSAKLSVTVPYIQAYSNGSKQFSAENVKAEISALTKSDIQSYILYNPNGTYDLGSLK